MTAGEHGGVAPRMGDIGEPLRRIEFDPMHEPAPAEPETAPAPQREPVPA